MTKAISVPGGWVLGNPPEVVEALYKAESTEAGHKLLNDNFGHYWFKDVTRGEAIDHLERVWSK